MTETAKTPAAPGSEFEAAARAFLAAQFGPRAPGELTIALIVEENPLEGEGRTAIFRFDLEPGPGAAKSPGCATADRGHYVAVGATTPNYFPAYDLPPDDAYSFHIGTRFMLEMEIQRVDSGLEPPGARDGLRRFLTARGLALDTAEELAALFRCEDDYFAVYRVSIGGVGYYFMGADCPAGFHAMTRHPPQAALRLHLGKLIRREAREGSAEHEPDRP